jgi:hypothetical protein
VPENETVLYRGASFELGRGPGYYGIWPAGAPRPPSIEWWPPTPEGWNGAWARFNMLEPAAAITQVGPPAGAPAGGSAGPAAHERGRAITAAALLGAGVVAGIAGLFPVYFGGASLARQSAEVVPHALYLAAWLASAVLILLGGTRLRAGALLGLGTSVVTFGLFFADAGTAITSGAHLVGAGLILGLAGWLACAAGSVTAFLIGPSQAQGWLRRAATGPVVIAGLTLAALGAAIAFAPPWDSYTLQTAGGAAQTVTAGNAFLNPGAVIFGNVAVMVTVVAVAAVAALWRPVRLGAALLAGAVLPLAAQAISAIIQIGQAPSPLQFGVTPGQASRLGLTISPGLTAAFWVYCAFVIVLLAACAWLARPARGQSFQPVPEPPRPPSTSPPDAGGLARA